MVVRYVTRGMKMGIFEWPTGPFFIDTWHHSEGDAWHDDVSVSS